MYSRKFDIRGLHDPVAKLRTKYFVASDGPLLTLAPEVMLRRAANKGCLKDVILIIRHAKDLDINAKSPTTGWTALHHAASKGHVQVFIILEQNDASITVIDNNLKTPLQIAEERGHKAILDRERATRLLSQIPREVFDANVLMYLSNKDIVKNFHVSLLFNKSFPHHRTIIENLPKDNLVKLFTALRRDWIPYPHFEAAAAILVLSIDKRLEWFNQSFPFIKIQPGGFEYRKSRLEALDDPFFNIAMVNQYYTVEMLELLYPTFNYYRNEHRNVREEIFSMEGVACIHLKKLNENIIRQYFLETHDASLVKFVIKMLLLDYLDDELSLEKIWEHKDRFSSLLKDTYNGDYYHEFKPEKLKNLLTIAASDAEIATPRPQTTWSDLQMR